MGILLGKPNPAPRNRGLILTEEDLIRFKQLPCLPARARAPQPLELFIDQIFHNRCQRGMALMPPGTVDLIIADPPYNNGKDYGAGKLGRLSERQYEAWADEWIRLAAHCLKPNGSIYICCDWQSSGMYQRVLAHYLKIKNRITWRREKGRGARTNWKNNMEDIWFAVGGPDYTFNLESVMVKKTVIAPYRDAQGQPKDWVEEKGERYRLTHPANIWHDITVPFWSMRENTPHPTQKPEKLIERLLIASSNTGDLVLDPFMGSGTTAAVARRHSRHFVGFEVNTNYLRLALKRLSLP
ncbi:MAG: site-specific DNA-methyltransferase [Acidobacteriota bacterium]